MNPFFSLVKWLFKAAIFFTLFAFALNNQADVPGPFSPPPPPSQTRSPKRWLQSLLPPALHPFVASGDQ